VISRRQFLLRSAASGAGLAAFSNRAGALEAQKILELAGTRAPSSGTYTRMFPDLPRQGANNPHLEEGLIELGENMKNDSNEPPRCKTAPAGYTYLGQFIDHDLTLDILPLHAANPRAEENPNYRTPCLDLDQLYGGGPTLSPFLYRNKEQDRGEERFLIGRTRPTEIGNKDFPCSLDDLPRNAEGVALTGDPRQDENLIIAQLHVAFLRVHNWALDKLRSGELNSAGPEGATCFEQARRLLTWHYQWIVRNDYLKKILDPDIYAEITKKDYKPRMRSLQSGFRIPIEFSGAAFRFGHSMVRNEYRINDTDDAHKNVLLKDVLGLSGARGGARPNLPADWKIDWNYFVPLRGEFAAQPSSNIDTEIVSGLYALSQDTKKLFATAMPGESDQCKPTVSKRGENDLPVITLLRGARMELPSGQEVAKALRIKNPLTDVEIVKDSVHKEILTKYGFHTDTPLWYYVLREAELRGGGCRLGPTGSKIVGDVIITALLSDQDSYLSINPDWKPALPTRKNGRESFDITDLIHFSINPDWKPIPNR